VLGRQVAGRFLLSYAGGQLTERIQKKAGKDREVAVYPGQAWLMLLRQGRAYLQEEVNFKPGTRVVIRSNPDPLPDELLGSRHQQLWEKGLDQTTLTATAVQPGISVLTGAGYEYNLAPAGFLLPRHLVTAGIRLDRAGWSTGARVGYGYGQESFGSWNYQLDALVAELHAGYGWDLGFTRLALAGSLGAGHLWETYDDQYLRNGWFIQPAGRLGFIIPTSGPLVAEVFARFGAAWAPGAGETAEGLWRLVGGIGLQLMARM